MYKKFCITIGNKKENYDIIFDVLKTNIAQKWAVEIAKRYEFLEIDRFTNWPNSIKNKEYYVTQLNKQIDIINDYKSNTIDTKINNNPDQETMNYLHVFFEQLRGPIGQESLWFVSAPDHIKDAICKFNILIHEYEHLNFNEEMLPITQHPYSTIVGTYKDRPRYDLLDEEYQHYTFNWKFGTVYINYCEVGKPILDVFKDDDEVIGDFNIKPLKYYSADWQVKFGPDTLDWVYEQRLKEVKDWFDRKSNYFNQLDIYWGSKIALGMIPVASINLEDSNLSNLEKIDIVNKLSCYQEIKDTWVK